MNPANIPQQSELNSLYGSWNPMAYMEGIKNQGLADQFRDQSYAANNMDMEGKMLANQQAEQINPLMVLDQQLKNQGAATKNASSDLDFSNKQTLNPDSLKAEQAALRTKYNNQQLEQMSTQILQAHLENIKSGDPTKIAETGSLLDFVTGAAGAAAERSQKRSLSELDVMSRENLARINGQNNKEAAQIRATRPGVATDSWSNYNKIRSAKDRHAAVRSEMAKIGEDSPEYPMLSRMADALLPQAQAEIASAKPGGIDAGAVTGMPTVQPPTISPQAKPQMGTAQNPIVLK
jgi:hypothetical protein